VRVDKKCCNTSLIAFIIINCTLHFDATDDDVNGNGTAGGPIGTTGIAVTAGAGEGDEVGGVGGTLTNRLAAGAGEPLGGNNDELDVCVRNGAGVGGDAVTAAVDDDAGGDGVSGGATSTATVAVVVVVTDTANVEDDDDDADDGVGSIVTESLDDEVGISVVGTSSVVDDADTGLLAGTSVALALVGAFVVDGLRGVGAEMELDAGRVVGVPGGVCRDDAVDNGRITGLGG
jgi:hypothetical protein